MRKLFTFAAVSLFTMISIAGFGQEAATKVQSLYIYNFAKYIQWSNISDKFVVGIYASQETFEQLSSILKTRNVAGKSFELKRLSSPSDASACHIVYVTQAFSGNVKKINEAGQVSNTLVVSERDLIGKGAAISFVIKDSKLKFKIDVTACEKAGLKVSNSLVALGA